MLGPRVVTALVLGTIAIAGTLYLPPALMSALVALCALLGGLEWAALSGLGRSPAAALYAAANLALALLLYRAGQGVMVLPLLCLALAWWCLATVWVLAYQEERAPRIHAVGLLGLAGTLTLVPALTALWWLLEHAPGRLLALFAIVWSADVLAYAGGRRYGQRRLAPKVSPGKTWEGLAAGTGGTLLLAVPALLVLRPTTLPVELLLVLVTVLAAAVGDLFESLIKRLRGVKDSGTLLPGHGGVLDRVDSILAAGPVHVFGLMILGVA